MSTRRDHRRQFARALIDSAPAKLQPFMLAMWGSDGDLPPAVRQMLLTKDYGNPGFVYQWYRRGFSFISSKTSQKYARHIRWLRDDWPREGKGAFPDGTKPAGTTSMSDRWEILRICRTKLEAQTMQEFLRRQIFGGPIMGALDDVAA